MQPIGPLDHYESTNNIRGGDTPHFMLQLDPKPSRELSPATDCHDNAGGEISEWGSRLPEPHIARGLDSMGLPKLSSTVSD